ncbi:MAG: hypothetical protein AAFP19_22300 [Bacteroidota bacterium]
MGLCFWEKGAMLAGGKDFLDLFDQSNYRFLEKGLAKMSPYVFDGLLVGVEEVLCTLLPSLRNTDG